MTVRTTKTPATKTARSEMGRSIKTLESLIANLAVIRATEFQSMQDGDTDWGHVGSLNNLNKKIAELLMEYNGA